MSKTRHTPSDEAHFLMRTYGATLPHDGQIAPHRHIWAQLIYAIRGVMTVWTEAGSWIVPPTWAIWAPAGESHSIRAFGDTEIRMLYFRPEQSAARPTVPTVIRVSPLLRELTIRTVQLRMLDSRVAAHGALALLIADELRAEPAQPFDTVLPLTEPLRSVALRMLTDHATRRVPVAEFASRVAMSTRTFERAFRADTGISFGRWRRRAALVQALRLLAVGTPVKVVATKVGFRNVSSFIVAFRQAFAQTPGQYFALPSTTR